MNKKKWCLKLFMVIVLFSVTASFSFAQSAAFFTLVFESESITWEQAAFLTMVGSDRLSDDVSPAQAWEALSKTQWYTNIPEKDSCLTISEFSYLLAKAFNVKGGLFYTLFNGKRYAYRELVFKKIIPSTFDPSALVKGTDAMKFLEKAMAFFPMNANTEELEAVK